MPVLRLFRVDDLMIKWFQKIDFWDEIVDVRIRMAEGLLPMDVELNLKQMLRNALDAECLLLLKKLVANPNGLSAEDLGFDRSEIQEVLSDGYCACAKLIHLGLATIRNKRYFRASRMAYHPKIQRLVFGSL